MNYEREAVVDFGGVSTKNMMQLATQAIWMYQVDGSCFEDHRTGHFVVQFASSKTAESRLRRFIADWNAVCDHSGRRHATILEIRDVDSAATK